MKWFPLKDWRLIKVTGPDAGDFLHRMTTNVLPKNVGEMTHTFLLSVQARPVGEFWALRLQDGYLLETPAGMAEQALAELDKFHFVEKMELKLLDLKGYTTLEKLEAGEVEGGYRLTNHRLGVEATDHFGEGAFPEGDPLPQEEVEKLRIRHGYPLFGQDYQSDTLFMEMALPDSYSESKGCYPGQEVVARVLHQGRVNRRLRKLRVEQPVEPGTELLAEGKKRGWITSCLEHDALGYVRREVDEENLKVETATGTPVEVLN